MGFLLFVRVNSPSSQHRLLAVPSGSKTCTPGKGLERNVPAGECSTHNPPLCLCAHTAALDSIVWTNVTLSLCIKGRWLMRINRLHPGRVRVAAGMRGVRQGLVG